MIWGRISFNRVGEIEVNTNYKHYIDILQAVIEAKGMHSKY